MKAEAGLAGIFGTGMLRRNDGTVIEFELRPDEPKDDSQSQEVDNHGDHSLDCSPPRGG